MRTDTGRRIALATLTVLLTTVAADAIDIGLRAYDGSNVVGIACEPDGTLTSPLRIAKGTNTYGVVLADPDDPFASGIVIQTASGPKAPAGIPDLPPDMAFIPGGPFEMGDSYGEGDSDKLPVHTVNVSSFVMSRHEVSKALWDEVYTWATGNGYLFDNPGSGKAPDHPVQGVNWYDCVKWCNARSEKEGLNPVYYRTSSKLIVYEVGVVDVPNDAVDWDANGYRLPTEAEWEKAARGGYTGRRFPWGDTISHGTANYNVYWPDYPNGTPYYPYDAGPEAGYHPDYDDLPTPYTSPVGDFAANDYGLYDMAGNVWEWCWDWHGTYPGTVTDPTGPASGSYRVLRGGSWRPYAYYCRVALRRHGTPTYSDYALGFRAVLSTGQ